MDINKVEVPLRAVRIYAHCGKCGAKLSEPILLPQGSCLNNQGKWVRMNEHQYLYKCPKCGEETESDIRYPYIEYQEEKA